MNFHKDEKVHYLKTIVNNTLLFHRNVQAEIGCMVSLTSLSKHSLRCIFDVSLKQKQTLTEVTSITLLKNGHEICHSHKGAANV